MKFACYFFFLAMIAFQGWASARPPESHCMMKEMSMHAQLQSCDEAMLACCDQPHTTKKSLASCQHVVDCQSSQIGVLGLALDKLQLFFTAIYTPTRPSLSLSPETSNVWRPPARG
jgi:hypothetical protein